MLMMSLTQARKGEAQSRKIGRSTSLVWVWLALLTVAVGGVSSTPIYARPHTSSALFFVMAATLFFMAFRQTEVGPIPRHYLAFLLPLGFSIVFLPWPCNLGSWLLSAFLIAITIGERSSLVRRASLALGATGLATLVWSGAQPILFRLFANFHGAPWAAKLASLALSIVGAKVSLSGSVIYLQTFEALVPVNVTYEALGMYYVAGLLVVGSALLFLLRANSLRFLAFVAVSVIYPIVRYLVLLLTYSEVGQTNLFWIPWITLLTFIPLPILIGRVVTGGLSVPGRVRWPGFVSWSVALRMLIAGSAATICVIGVFSFQDPGTPKQGRVLIDEAHSNWEWTTRRYDTKWYSQASGYNYYCLADYLSRFYQVSRGKDRITPKLLKNYDVLVLKTLTRPLDKDEIEAIVGFVRAGGGLWLVGDHTNVFGISSHINPLAQRFGMSFNYDATYDLETGGLTVYRPSVMLPHPTVQHMPPVFLFGTSCSMRAGLLADYPVIGYGLRSLQADYAQENFFPENKATLDQEFGLLPQAVAMRYGKGRVAAWTDSTVFSNFWFYMPGKSELCLGTINWLNRSNRWGCVRWILCLAVVGIAVLGLRWSRGANTNVVAACTLAGLLLGVSAGTCAFSVANRAAYPLPTPHQPLPKICFEREHCNFTLPSEALDSSMALENHYHTFFVWTQRLGYIPNSTPSLAASLANAKVVVLTNPNKNFTAEEKLSIKRYLRAGGRVLVLDCTQNQASTANDLLKDYGIKIEESALPQSFVFDRDNRRILAATTPRAVIGGEPVLTMAYGKPFVTTRRVGKGLLVAMGSSQLFTDRSMGTTSTVPDAYQSGIYEMEFWLFRNLMEGPSDPKRWRSLRPMQQR